MTIAKFRRRTRPLAALLFGTLLVASQAPSLMGPATALAAGDGPTTTTISSSRVDASFGTSVTYTVTVAGSGTPTGTVAISDGTTGIGSCTLTSGSCTFSTSALAIGGHAITAAYSGDASRNASTSSAFTQTIVKATTTTTVAADPTTSTWGGSVTFTVTVAPGSATGIVELSDGTTRVGSCTLAAGSCTITSATLPAGTRSLVARYPGDANRAAGTSATLSYVVAKLGSTTSVTA